MATTATETIVCKHCNTRNTWARPECWPRCGGCGRPIGRVMSPEVLRAYAKLASVAKDGKVTLSFSGGGETACIDADAAARIKKSVNAELRRQKIEGRDPWVPKPVSVPPAAGEGETSR